MRLVLTLTCIVAGLGAQTKQTPVAVDPNAVDPKNDPTEKIRQAMQPSVEKQIASVRRQVTAVHGEAAVSDGFFSIPWTRPPAFATAAVSLPCDPLAPEQAANLVNRAAWREGLMPELLRAVIHTESAFRPCAVSAKGAVGLMQLMPSTVRQLEVVDPFDPEQNVDAGSRLLKQLLARYSGDVSLALGAYNAGAGRVDREGRIPEIPETLRYVSDILKRSGLR